jgi:cytidine deaminase
MRTEMVMDAGRLLDRAKKAAAQSYSPYSNFPVGAALQCADGTVVTAANVENRSYGLTVCAERNAVFAAVSMGRRDFMAIAVFCPAADYPVPPCGACRQVLSEFSPGMTVIFSGRKGEPVVTSLGELFPRDSLHELKKK